VLGKQSLEQIGNSLRHSDKGVTAKASYIGVPVNRPALKLINRGKA